MSLRQKIKGYCVACNTDTVHDAIDSKGDIFLCCEICGYKGELRKSLSEVKNRASEIMKHTGGGSKSASHLRKVLYAQLVDSRSCQTPKRYSQSILLNEQQLVDHPRFGLGAVIEIRKMEFKAVVLFKDCERLMRCGGSMPDDE